MNIYQRIDQLNQEIEYALNDGDYSLASALLSEVEDLETQTKFKFVPAEKMHRDLSADHFVLKRKGYYDTTYDLFVIASSINTKKLDYYRYDSLV